MLKRMIKSGKELRIISADDLKENDYAMRCAFFGSPLIMIKKISSGHEVEAAVQAMKDHFLKYGPLEGKIGALIPMETGGYEWLDSALHSSPVGISSCQR